MQKNGLLAEKQAKGWQKREGMSGKERQGNNEVSEECKLQIPKSQNSR